MWRQPTNYCLPFMMHTLLTLCGIYTTVYGFESPELLSELPIHSLLLKKRSALIELASCNATSHGPQASALVRPLDHMQIRGRPIDRGHYEAEEEEEEEEEEEWEWMPMMKAKGKGIGQLFDGSVTALSFLAFAGYLICLVVHAIKEKNDKETENINHLYQQMLNMQQRPVSPLTQFRPGGRRRRRRRAPAARHFETLNTAASSPLLSQFIEKGFKIAEDIFLDFKLNKL